MDPILVCRRAKKLASPLPDSPRRLRSAPPKGPGRERRRHSPQVPRDLKCLETSSAVENSSRKRRRNLKRRRKSGAPLPVPFRPGLGEFRFGGRSRPR